MAEPYLVDFFELNRDPNKAGEWLGNQFNMFQSSLANYGTLEPNQLKFSTDGVATRIWFTNIYTGVYDLGVKSFITYLTNNFIDFGYPVQIINNLGVTNGKIEFEIALNEEQVLTVQYGG